jgi:hypothetical protein
VQRQKTRLSESSYFFNFIQRVAFHENRVGDLFTFLLTERQSRIPRTFTNTLTLSATPSVTSLSTLPFRSPNCLVDCVRHQEDEVIGEEKNHGLGSVHGKSEDQSAPGMRDR